MNIGGVRQGMEDMSAMGTVGRGGVCIAENEAQSPWEPLQTRYGFTAEDSTVTMFWPADVQTLGGGGLGGAFTPESFLKSMCQVKAFGWWTGGVFILSPEIAAMFAQAGWTKQRILDYVVEYNRVPADEWNLRWLVESNHEPRKDGGIPVETPPGRQLLRPAVLERCAHVHRGGGRPVGRGGHRRRRSRRPILHQSGAAKKLGQFSGALSGHRPRYLDY